MVIFNFRKIISGVAVRHLGVRCLWGQGLAAAAMMNGLVLGIFSETKKMACHSLQVQERILISQWLESLEKF
jgi:hypothetical protein